MKHPPSSLTRRRLRSLATCCIGLFWSVAIADAKMVPATDARISLEGRTEVVAPGTVRLAYPGITLRVICEGTGLVLRGHPSSERILFDLSIDGAPFIRVRFPPGENSIVLYADLPAKRRTVTLVRRNESWQGTFDLQGLECIGGELLTPPPLPTRRLLFIGDSITCGAGTDVVPGEDAEGYRDSNGRLSFGTVLARRLGAQVHLVSYGGKGLVRDWQGMRSEVTAPQFYERSLPDDPAARWNHRGWVPDAITVCLGQNDFNRGLPDEQDWVAAYVALLEKLRRDAPEAPIFLLNSPMHGDDPPALERLVLRRYLGKVIDVLGDPLVQAIEIGHYPGRPEDAHPVAAEHEAIADELEPVFRARLAW